jgi:lambda family phage portal protein
MGIIDRALARFGYSKGRRAFSGAQTTHLTASWTTNSVHVNADLQRGLTKLRARSRDLEQNNDYARKFLSMVETNVVGHSGFSLFVEPKRPDGSIDRFDAATIERAFWKWAAECEVTGLSFVELQRLFIRTVARDGEVLVREVSRGTFGYQLQLIDPQRLDELYNDDLPAGKVRMGVEYDSIGVVQAYWLNDDDTADPKGVSSQRRRVRVPASECRLYFTRSSIGQLRGVPMMASAMLRLQMLGGYEEAAVVAARVGAAKLGVIKTPDGDVSSLGEPSGQDVLIDGDPGSFVNLPPGSDLQSWNPDYPHAQFGDFVRACLRGISSGLGVSYATLANDLENVNYSSIRAGVLEEREVWKGLQNWMMDAFLVPMFGKWLRYALTSGQLDPLPASRYEKFSAHRWQGRRWDWVDPEKDMNANILAIKHGLKSRTEIVAEQGRDLADVWQDLAQEQTDASAQDIKLWDLTETEKALTPAPAPMAPNDQPARDVAAAVVALAGREQPQPVVNVTVERSETVIRNEVQPTPVEVAAPAVTVENRVEAPVVNVEAPKIENRIEVTAPEYVEVDTAAKFDEKGRMTGTRTVKQRLNKH